MTLREAEVGKHYKVIRINEKGAYKRRIMDMGLTKGTNIYVRKVAPLGDPIQINIRDYELSLRKADAGLVEIEELSNKKNDAN